MPNKDDSAGADDADQQEPDLDLGDDLNLDGEDKDEKEEQDGQGPGEPELDDVMDEKDGEGADDDAQQEGEGAENDKEEEQGKEPQITEEQDADDGDGPEEMAEGEKPPEETAQENEAGNEEPKPEDDGVKQAPVRGTDAAEEEKPEETGEKQTENTAPPQNEAPFGVTTGDSAPMENVQEQQEQSESTSGRPPPDGGRDGPAESVEQGGSSSRPTADTSATKIKDKPPDSKHAQENQSKDAPERKLQKVPVVDNNSAADEDTIPQSKEQKEDAPKGLHEIDQKDGFEALGESRDPGALPDGVQLDDNMDCGEDSEGEKDPAMTEEKDSQRKRKGPQEKMDAPQLPGAPPEMPEPGKQDQAKLDNATMPGAGSTSVVGTLPPGLNAEDASMQVDVPAGEENDEAWQKAERRAAREAEASRLWRWLEGSTAPLAAALCEQLRIILEPTLKGRLQGDYRTGKRISMRKVIAFIASNYRRDKIWLRRTKPSKREYQVIVAIDNSRSMAECGVAPIALQTLCVLCQALARIEVGEYAVLAFGSGQPRTLLPLGAGLPHTVEFGWEQARPLLAEFSFEEESAESHNRSLVDMLRLCAQLFDDRSGGQPPQPFCQMMLIITDGRFNKAKVRPLVHAALSRQQLPLLIIVDSAGIPGIHTGTPLEPVDSASASASSAEPSPSQSKSKMKPPNTSVFDLKQVSYEKGQCKVTPYLQEFPFPYYLVVQDIQALPSILADVMRQWFELVAGT